MIKLEVRLLTAGLSTTRDRKRDWKNKVDSPPSGEVAATIRLEATSDTVPRLRAWAIRWTQRQWAVEGATGLVTTWPKDVPAQLAARARLLNTGHARKTDPSTLLP